MSGLLRGTVLDLGSCFILQQCQGQHGIKETAPENITWREPANRLAYALCTTIDL